jgi:hypothetical protein
MRIKFFDLLFFLKDKITDKHMLFGIKWATLNFSKFEKQFLTVLGKKVDIYSYTALRKIIQSTGTVKYCRLGPCPHDEHDQIRYLFLIYSTFYSTGS